MKLIKGLLLIGLVISLVSCSHHRHKKWQNMDTNNDGKVSKKEFMMAKEKKFKMMDENKDGHVTMEEKKKCRKKKY